jgi:hypothetical protein
LHISVLGGSWTYGRFCFDGVRNDTACAWPARLQDRLREVYPAANISISNKARPGNHYRPWLAAGDLETVLDGTDIVIIDLQVNSQVRSGSGLVSTGSSRASSMFAFHRVHTAVNRFPQYCCLCAACL